MKLPVQASAVVRGGFSWPTRRPAPSAGSVAGIEASGGGVISCKDPTPFACVCDNGIATCCSTSAGCTVDPGTGACSCMAKSP